MSTQFNAGTTRLSQLIPSLMLCLTMGLAGCKTMPEGGETQDATDAQVQSEALNSGPDASMQAEMAAGSDHSLGACSVRMNAPVDSCGKVRGKTATGVAPGCQHANCTTAKENARRNLMTGIPAACGAYIDCGAPCRCIQK
jgi:hypothetical protein